MRYLLLLYVILCLSHSAKAQTSSFLDYLERIQTKKDPLQTAKIIQRRLEVELTIKKEVNVDNVVLGLQRLVRLDVNRYNSFLLQVAQAPIFNGNDALSGALFLRLLEGILAKQSAADAFRALTTAPDTVKELFLVSFVGKAVSLGYIREFVNFFDKNEELLAKLPDEKLRSLLEYYCERRYFNETNQCVQKLDKYSIRFKNPNWIVFVKAVAYLGDGEIEKSANALKQISSAEMNKCSTSVNDVPWFHFIAAQLWRMRGELDKSKICLQIFKQNVTYSLASFFYNLETARIQRQLGELGKTELTLQEAKIFVSTNNDFIHQMLYDLELLKNHAANNEKTLFFEKIDSFKVKVEGKKFEYFLPVVAAMRKVFEGNKVNTIVLKDNFESLDFKLSKTLKVK